MDSPALQKLHQMESRIDPARKEAFLAALTAETTRRTRQFITGVRAYQGAPQQSPPTAAPIIWHSGTTCLRDYNPGHSGLPVLLVIPSLINRFDILDLATDHSFLRWMAERGFRPLVIDWGSPGASEKTFGLTDYVIQRLVPALRTVLQSVRQQPIHLAGYCMGGLLAMALAQITPRDIRSLTLIATPWDFHKGYGDSRDGLSAMAPRLLEYLDSVNEMPVDMLQGLFAAQQPFKVLNKFMAFADLDINAPSAQRFIRLEDWLNDGVPLTGPVARACLADWFIGNKTAQGQWTIDGQIIDPLRLTMPGYVIAPGHDRIVPPQSTMALTELLPNATLQQPMMGHIGLMASQKAPQQVWSPLAAWLRKQS